VLDRNEPQNPATPLDSRTFFIGVLGVTAVVLFACLVLLATQPRAAYATGQNDRGGDYIMLTQQVSNSTEAIVVIDGASKRMILYGYDYNAKQIKVLQRNVPLDRLQGRGEQPAPP
jgi:hypothetical protein